MLGPLQVRVRNGRRVKLSGPRQEKVLAALLIDAGVLVSVDRLVSVVWAERPPATARRQIQDLISRLRRVLLDVGACQDVLQSERDGYVLRLADWQCDALRFRAAVAEARAQRFEDPTRAAASLRCALALWRGPALFGIDSPALLDAAAAWDQLRASAWEECLAIEVAYGGGPDPTSELVQLVAQDPFRERPVLLLMRELHRQGRRAHALEAYRKACARFTDELGIEPGAELQTAYRLILRDEPMPPAGSAAGRYTAQDLLQYYSLGLAVGAGLAQRPETVAPARPTSRPGPGQGPAEDGSRTDRGSER